MGVQAREVVREGKRLGFTFRRMSYGSCAVGFLSQKTNISTSNRQAIAENIGLVKPGQPIGHALLWAIERGFEDYSTRGIGQKRLALSLGGTMEDGVDGVPISKLYRYYRVGRNIARLAGLPLGRRHR